MDQHRQDISALGIRVNGREVTDAGELAAHLLRVAVDKAIADDQPLGHEALAAVILPQVAEADRAHLEIGLFAAFRSGLFQDVSPEVCENLPNGLLSHAIVAGRELFMELEAIQASRNPTNFDFRLEDLKAVAAWLKLVENRVPVRNRLVVYSRLGNMFKGGFPVDKLRSQRSDRGGRVLAVEPAADIEPAPAPRPRLSNLNKSELARRAAALQAAQAASQK